MLHPSYLSVFAFYFIFSDFQVCLAMVFPPVGAMGIVDYTNYDDMKYAVCLLESMGWFYLYATYAS